MEARHVRFPFIQDRHLNPPCNVRRRPGTVRLAERLRRWQQSPTAPGAAGPAVAAHPARQPGAALRLHADRPAGQRWRPGWPAGHCQWRTGCRHLVRPVRRDPRLPVQRHDQHRPRHLWRRELARLCSQPLRPGGWLGTDGSRHPARLLLQRHPARPRHAGRRRVLGRVDQHLRQGRRCPPGGATLFITMAGQCAISACSGERFRRRST
jgi:hypothetical protein